jgi:outer membrane protein TolC
MRYLKIYLILTVLCLILPISSRGLGGSQQEKNSEPAEATLYDYTSRKSFPEIFSAYTVPFVPRARLENSRLLSELIADGKLKLSLEDAIVLALENNLDIAVARYDLPIAQTDLLRAKAGGATRGVAGAYQSSAIFSGVIGGGIGNGRSNGGGGGGTVLGGGIPSLGAVGCCDPTVSVFYGWDHAVNPLNFTVVSGVPIETTRSADVSGSYSQGFLTGTSIFVNVNGYREASNATTQLFNPFINSGLFVGVNQQLLNGFGYRANAKFIRIARNDQKYALSVFRQNVINTVAKVMTTYYDLLADLENIRVTDEGLQYAKDLLNDNETEAQIGAAAQLDVVRAEEEVAARQQDRLVAGNTFAQDAQSLKAEISKSFNGEIAAVQVEPVDQLPEPHADDIPSLAEALREAAENRPEIEQAQLNLRNQQVTIQAVRNELLPTLDAYAIYTPSGLSGEFGSSFGQLFHGRFPNYAYGLELSIPIRNRTAQADAARALLEQRQLQMKLQQAENQVVWDVSKAVSAVEQAKSQLEAAVKVTALARQTLDMEQTKFKVGQASVEEVINSQRDLATAENNVVKAKTAYAQALIQFEQATGTILKKNHIELTDAVRGDVPRPPQIPGTPAQ